MAFDFDTVMAAGTAAKKAQLGSDYMGRTLGSFGTNPYAIDANATSAIYDPMRARLNTQYNQQQQQGQDAIDRQFAAMGGGPGNGAQAKQTENLATGIAQQKGQDLLSLNSAEAETNMKNQQFNAGLNTQWDTAGEQANNDAYNMALNSYKASHSGGLFGGGGFLGFGVGG